MQDVILSLLAKEPAHGYELRQRLVKALGPAGRALNPGQVYVTLSRLERAGLVEAREVAQPSHPDKKVYELTASGRERVMLWLTDMTWSSVRRWSSTQAGRGGGDAPDGPVALVDSQRLELLRELRQLQELALQQPPDSDGALRWRARHCACRPTSAGSRCASSAWSRGSRDERR